MVSAAGVRNRSPAGWNLTALTPSPVGAVIVIVVPLSSAPGGMTSVCGPALMLPPSGPIVTVDWAYGRFEQRSKPVEPSNEPISDASGAAGTAGDGGASVQDCETSKTRTRTANARTAFMSFSLSMEVLRTREPPRYKMGPCRGPCGEK